MCCAMPMLCWNKANSYSIPHALLRLRTYKLFDFHVQNIVPVRTLEVCKVVSYFPGMSSTTTYNRITTTVVCIARLCLYSSGA